MANTLNLGNGNWAAKEGSLLAYNNENGNFKPLPFDFTRASSATRVNSQGLIEVVERNQPRVDYSSGEGALLLEPSRSNLVTYSEDFSNWTSGSTYTTQNYAISPDGTQNASRLLFTGLAQNIYINTSATGDVVGSLYVKGTSGETIQLFVGGGETQFTLNGNWQRIVVEKTSSTNGFININTNGGATARDLLIWGAQLEQGSYATSYIPTQGAAVTRVDETLVQDNMSTSLFNKDGMAFYLEVEALANDDIIKAITISDGSNSNRFVFQFTDNNEINVFSISTLGFTGLSIVTAAADITQTNKIAASFNSSNGYLYVNGTQINVDAINNVIGNNLNKISFGNHNLAQRIFYGKIMDFKTYNTALTDEELAALTTI